MKFNLILTGIIFGLVGGYFIGQLSSDEIVKIVDEQSTGIIAFCVVVFTLIIIGLLFSDKVIRAITSAKNTQLTTWFDDFSKSVFSVFNIPKSSADLIAQPVRDALAIYISWRTRSILFGLLIAIVVVIVGSISTHVTIEQNRKLDAQNTLIGEQNSAVRVQLLLAESARYDVYADRVADLTVEIANAAQLFRSDRRREYEESRDQDQFGFNSFAQFDADVWDEIGSTLELLDPYPVFDTKAITQNFDSFSELEVEFLSSERGNLLKSLLNERVELSSAKPLVFDYADLRNFKLSYPFALNGVQLDRCDDPWTDLSYHSLDQVDFSGSIITAVNFGGPSKFNASSTGFLNSRVTLPIIDRLPLNDKGPGLITFIDSTIVLDADPEKTTNQINLENVSLFALEAREDGTNCAEFQFTHDMFGSPIIPEILFSGATLTMVGKEGFGIEKRREAFRILNELSVDGGEVIVQFSDVVDALVLTFFQKIEGQTTPIQKALLDANADTSVRLISKGIPPDILKKSQDWMPDFWLDGKGRIFVLEFF